MIFFAFQIIFVCLFFAQHYVHSGNPGKLDGGVSVAMAVCASDK